MPSTTPLPASHYDVLIVGCGIAGLSLALRLPRTLNICILSKSPPQQSNTWYAQGGISAAIDSQDSVESHIEDTMRSGAGLCRPEVVRTIVKEAPAEIEWLRSLQVDFTTQVDDSGNERLHLSQEGGHSHRRVVHSYDHTGRQVQTTLLEIARNQNNIFMCHTYTVVDLIVRNRECLGIYALGADDKVNVLTAGKTVLATGGAGKVYLYTSNPDSASGDGVAMAWRGGCRVANLEFMQFHPTCLYCPGKKTLLISEAVRGEGARLLLPSGDEFMHRYTPSGSLATRDIVAQAIDKEMKRLGAKHLYLDISHKEASETKKMFPSLYQRCLEFGYDLTQEALPIVPAAHYMCGGIVVDSDSRTDLENLYAVGEVACTGLHGANRIASNSLLECLACAHFAANAIAQQMDNSPTRPKKGIADWDISRVVQAHDKVINLQNWSELRHVMWNYVGISRNEERLLRAKQRIDLICKEIENHYGRFHISTDFIELRNLATVAKLIVMSALKRKESRGLHYVSDYPHQQPHCEDTILKKETASA